MRKLKFAVFIYVVFIIGSYTCYLYMQQLIQYFIYNNMYNMYNMYNNTYVIIDRNIFCISRNHRLMILWNSSTLAVINVVIATFIKLWVDELIKICGN